MNEDYDRNTVIASLRGTLKLWEQEEQLIDGLLRELEEKSDAEEFRTPKEIADYDDPTARFYLFTCPTCGYHLSEGMKYYKAYDYCPHCGQAIKWPEVEE